MNIFSYLAESFDLPILEWMAANLRSAFGDGVMPIITLLGDAGIFWIACAVALLFIPRYRKTGLAMGAALLMGLLVCNVTLKPLIARPRPYDYIKDMAEYGYKTIELLVETPHDYAFPSGHTLASFEAATVLMIHDKRLGIPAMVLAVLISFSRLYLYVHYPTDVIFSVFLGIGFAYLGNFLVNKGFAAWESRKGISN